MMGNCHNHNAIPFNCVDETEWKPEQHCSSEFGIYRLTRVRIEGNDTESFKPVAGSSHNLVTFMGLSLSSEIALVTALRLFHPQLLYIAIG